MKRTITLPLWAIPMFFIAYGMGLAANYTMDNVEAGVTDEAKAIPALTNTNAKYVNSFQASKAPKAGRLLPLDVDGKFPATVIPQGAGSGLDADFIDGLDSAEFVTYGDLIATVTENDGSASGVDADLLDGIDSAAFAQKTDIVSTMLNNDGSGSGLDADYIDGQDASVLAKYYKGTQVQSTVAVGANEYWFTFGYSNSQLVVWQAVPKVAGGKVKLEVETEAGANNTLTYWLRVTNTGAVNTSYDLVRWTYY